MSFANERERQRFHHLVLGRPRPKQGQAPAPRKRCKRRIGKAAEPVLLLPGIEERVQLRERWQHKQAGTPETHEHADHMARRPGSIARLFASGAIDREQLAAAEAIAEAHRAITADVRVRTASLETRVDGGEHGRHAAELFGRVRAELTYDRWRALVGGPVDLLLSVIVYDVGLTIAARRYRTSMPRARRLLGDALDLWWTCLGRTRRAAATATERQA